MSSNSGAIVLTSDEKKEFAKAAIEALNNTENLAQFEKDIENIGTSAVQIDQAFDRVSHGFKDMVTSHGSDFPEVAGYKKEWDSYKVVGAVFTPPDGRRLTRYLFSAGFSTSGNLGMSRLK